MNLFGMSGWYICKAVVGATVKHLVRGAGYEHFVILALIPEKLDQEKMHVIIVYPHY